MEIDGQKIAEKIFASLRATEAPTKELAAIMVGSDPASDSFLKQKEKTAKALGVTFTRYELPETLSQKELEAKVREISKMEQVGGVIVQLPLPKKYDRILVLNAIGIRKDVDVLNGETTRILAPAAGSLEAILSELEVSLAEKHVALIGSGLLIGQPIATWLMQRVQKLTIMNKGGVDPHALKDADIVIVGVGKPNLIHGDDLKEGVVVIDYGYAKEDGVLKGDVHYDSVREKAAHITPVPGGTGPIVVAKLFENFYTLGKF